MREFAALFEALDASTATGDKLLALQGYFAQAPDEDAAWAVYFLSGGKPRQAVPTAVLRAAACAESGLDDWLFEECYQVVGDLAETIAQVLPAPAQRPDGGLAFWVEARILPLRGLAPAEQQRRVIEAWRELDVAGRFLYVKLIGGGFRVGVAKLLVQRALAEAARLPVQRVAERMVGYTDARRPPGAADYRALIVADHAVDGSDRGGQSYPFFLAHALQGEPATVAGDPRDWIVEWKYDGIRAQLVRRGGQTWLWSRGEELITERYPEVSAVAAGWPSGLVLDGELLAWGPDATQPMPFQALQKRIGRKTIGKKLLAEVPVRFLAYDLLELDGHDLRRLTQAERRARLVALGLPGLEVSPVVEPPAELSGPAAWAWLAERRSESRSRGVEGLMLKHRDALYGIGRSKAEGLWWKYKIEPLVADAVLVYAQAGHGRRAGVYTDYTFALWNRAPRDAAEAQAVLDAISRRDPAPRGDPLALQLVPFAKAYSGLTDEEFAVVDREIRRHTLENFGPVRSVLPTLVFELGFEGIAASPRHKSGIAVRFPRMLRIRHDKPLWQADTLDGVRQLAAGSL
ncbi:MAG: cisplatin damage response ATP-dependent DNA ligase [Rubrivivax sp.]|jgi:DNA ligase-1|nr:cisplatin damage response ATP-dependent DNA ligase [Rubrivivax sp.]